MSSHVRGALIIAAAILAACTGSTSQDTADREAVEPPSAPESAPEPAPEPPVDMGRWRAHRSTNPLDDSPTVGALLEATEGVGGILDNEEFRLIARCQSNTTEVYVEWYYFLGTDDRHVTYRFPPADAVTESWGLGTDNTSTFVANPIPFLRELVASDRLVMQTIPYNENPSMAIFDLTGAREAIVPIAETCGWTF